MKAWRSIILIALSMATLIIFMRLVFDGEFGVRILISSVFTGLTTALLFYYTFPIFLKFTAKNLMKTIPGVHLNEGEIIILQSPATHFKDMEAVGGRLTLTNKKTCFSIT